MVWWIAGGVLVVGVAVLVGLIGALGRDVAELHRVADLARERAASAQRRLQPKVARVQADMAQLQTRVEQVAEHRMAEPPPAH